MRANTLPQQQLQIQTRDQQQPTSTNAKFVIMRQRKARARRVACLRVRVHCALLNRIDTQFAHLHLVFVHRVRGMDNWRMISFRFGYTAYAALSKSNNARK